MSDRNPLAYTGRIEASTARQGDVQFNASQFSVVNGVVQLAGQGLAVDTIAGDSGSATPTAAGQITLAGGTGLTSSATSNTVTLGLDANTTALQYADVTLTSTEIKALRATPITLVAAPGAGNALLFQGALLKLNYGGTNAFTETDDNLAVRFTDGSGVIVSATIESTAFITATADTMTNAIPKADAIVAAASAENQALVLHNTGDGEIAGNAADDNTVTLRIFYNTVAI